MLKQGVFKRLEVCRFCDSELFDFISLGDSMPLAGGFLKSESEFADERGYPLTLAYCKNCYTVQCREVVDNKLLFCKG
jgi:hypothetical protein